MRRLSENPPSTRAALALDPVLSEKAFTTKHAGEMVAQLGLRFGRRVRRDRGVGGCLGHFDRDSSNDAFDQWD